MKVRKLVLKAGDIGGNGVVLSITHLKGSQVSCMMACLRNYSKTRSSRRRPAKVRVENRKVERWHEMDWWHRRLSSTSLQRKMRSKITMRLKRLASWQTQAVCSIHNAIMRSRCPSAIALIVVRSQIMPKRPRWLTWWLKSSVQWSLKASLSPS